MLYVHRVVLRTVFTRYSLYACILIRLYIIYIYASSVIRFVIIVNCKLTNLHSCFISFIPGLLLSFFLFYFLGSSFRGSSLDQWLAIHLIGLIELLVMYIYVVCGLDQAPFYFSFQ